MSTNPGIDATLMQIPARLRHYRQKKDMSLAALGKLTGISSSTLSRLESGQRRASLELLLPIAAALSVPLDAIVATPLVEDPRVLTKSIRADGRVMTPLSRTPGKLQAFKISLAPWENEVALKTHPGYEWFYVLSGRLRVVLGEHDIVMGPGEVAEFDTTTPHWFGAVGGGPVELLSLFGKQGERMHLRARPER